MLFLLACQLLFLVLTLLGSHTRMRNRRVRATIAMAMRMKWMMATSIMLFTNGWVTDGSYRSMLYKYICV